MLQAWANGLDYDRALPMLDWDGDQVVADGTLHRTRAGARRHVGEIRIVVHPEYRTRGLGTTLMHELAAIADETGIERLVRQLVSRTEEAAIRAAEIVGFVKLAVLPGHGKDIDGHPRDIGADGDAAGQVAQLMGVLAGCFQRCPSRSF